MFSRQKCFKTGVYRSNGTVESWKFRITLKKIYSLIEIPRFDQSNEIDPFKESSSNLEEQVDLSWQEKIFSQYEIEYYSVKENCVNDLQKSYHQTILSTAWSENRKKGNIFTYTTADNYGPDEEFNINKFPLQIKNDQEDCFETMFIMADLDPEVVLFTLKWNSIEHILLVYPDFNCMNFNPYYKEIQGDSRQMYHFGIKNLCYKPKQTTSNETFQIDSTLLNKLKTFTLREEMLKDHFCYPDNHECQYMILLEIKYGKHFLYDNTHIRFKFELPVESKVINGSTHGCTHSSKKTNGMWQYAHCHELTLKVPESQDIGALVTIFFQVISIDSWKRERLLGNAFIKFPLKSQINEKSLVCLNISNNQNFYDKLEAFLVGGRRTINFKEFSGINDSDVLNRYGSRAQLAGELDIKCQIVQHKKPHLFQLSGPNTKRYVKYRTNAITIEELLSSYQRARERLEEIVNLKY